MSARHGGTFALEARQVHARLGGTAILHGVDVAFATGRWTSVVGPNGAGKSTLLKVLAGLLPCRGEVRLHGRALRDHGGRARARQLAWLGQGEGERGGADDLTVYDVAMLGRLPHQRWLAAPGAGDRAAVERALRTTQAGDWRDRPLGALSGGERQRVLLARALAVEAEVLLMDEPLANLDPPHQADWLQTVRALVADGRTVVSVLHEISMALQADALVLVEAGRVVHGGACADAATHRAVEAVFGGRIAVRRLDDQWVAVPR